MYAGTSNFIPETYTVTCHIKASHHRALANCAKIHGISKTKLAIMLLEDAILREAQSHNPSISIGDK